MENDPTNGYEAIAQDFIAYRRKSAIGVEAVRSWAHTLLPNATILDLGCGNGIPITEALVKDGYTPYGIDASPTLVASFRDHFPDLTVACESAETSDFFDRKFDGIVAWGLMFLLSESIQTILINRISSTLTPGGQFLFTSPEQACTWTDIMTGVESRSLGAEKYERILSSAGLSLISNDMDEGENYYYVAKK
ncbi:class I SAM-dependent methyltransferase [Fodinibius salsisoli]|uniref:Class I SAM-dependent methyltransferase n=1 Tax=Fodinibius salsisoli TaxID=2820877 RepID=A0ABT3PIV5_9BACT|nr:class I SAM-dependent methyltransferase [Fodinibius salsisoli]MCW9705874.1 class I SAM-dependent methyltransferase [Fodinibius salsisoli]